MARTYELYDSAMKALGPRRVARVLQVGVSHAYRMARAPMGEGHAEGTGARNDLDRIEALVMELAKEEKGRAVLVEWQGHFSSLFDRALGRWQREPLTREGVVRGVGQVMREFGTYLQAFAPDQVNPEVVAEESGYLLEEIEKLTWGAIAGMAQERPE